MKIKSLLIVVFTTITLSCYATQSWQYVGNNPVLSGGNAIVQSLVFNSLGTAYIAYLDEANANKATVLKYNGTTWEIVGIAGFSVGAVSYLSLAISSANVPYIAYRDEGMGGKTMVMMFNGSSWTPVGNSNFISAGSAIYQSLVISPTGVPCVAFQDIQNSKKTTVMMLGGSNHNTWYAVGGNSLIVSNEGASSYQSLAFNSAGEPCVVWSDANWGSRIRAYRYTGSTWTGMGNFIGAGAAFWGKLAISPSGDYYLAYRDDANGMKTTVMKFNGSSTWVPVGSVGISAGRADFQSLDFNSSGVPYVAYADLSTGSYKPTILKFNGTSWGELSGTVKSLGYYMNLKINPITQEPWIAHVSTDQTQTLTYVQKYSETPTWQYVVGDNYYEIPAQPYSSLAFKSGGEALVSFPDAINGFKTSVRQFNGVGWGVVGSSNISAGYSQYQSLAISPSNVPYVAFSDGANGFKTTVLSYNGTTWNPVGSVGISAGQASFQSLAISSSGVPHVAYSDFNNGNKVTVLKYNGTSWQVVGSVGISAGYAMHVSLVIDPSGVPYVSYEDFANASKTTVLKFNGTSWIPVGTVGISSGAATYQSLAISSSGIPYVAYRDEANGKTTVLKFDGTTWNAAGNPGISAGSASWQSLVIHPSGIPYVAYKDDVNGTKTTVLNFNGNNWNVVGSPGISDAISVGGISLKINPVTGEPWVSYCGLGSNNVFNLAIQRYGVGALARLENQDVEETLTNTSLDNLIAYPNPSENGIFYLSNLGSGQKNGSLYDITGNRLASFSTSSESYELDASGYLSGLYYLKLSSENGDRSRKLIIK